MKPLVSILIPAYNAELLIAYTLESAISQTWPRKEIIVVNDGSTDMTLEVAQRFASKAVAIVSTPNQGLSAAVNTAYKICQGDYIQELDADDILAPNKIEKQLLALKESDTKHLLLSSPWAYFHYRTHHAKFERNLLWEDLTPVEWLLRKMGENLHMQNATWLVSRELAERAGPWDTQLRYDQDGEYFTRVLLASEGTRFVPEARVFYRASGANRVSFIGKSNAKRNSLLRSMKLHIQYLRSIEESDRVDVACLKYLQNWSDNFYPDRQDIIEELQKMAAELGGKLRESDLRWKYAWMKPIIGWNGAKWAQRVMPETKAAVIRTWDKVMFKLESRSANR